MKLTTDGYALTHWENDDGSEDEIRISYYHQTIEQMTQEYPGCPEELIIESVEIKRPSTKVLYQLDWYEFDDYTTQDEECWAEEILELIKEQDND